MSDRSNEQILRDGGTLWDYDTLKEICEDDRMHDAVECPQCGVTTFAYAGDYLCMVCRNERE